MWAHTPLNLPWSSDHQFQSRTDNRHADGTDSQTLALVDSILESAVILTTYIPNLRKESHKRSALVPLINSMQNFLQTR